MIELPTTPTKGDDTRVKSMLIISRPKVGKTQALMQLPNSLLIDLEESSRYFDGTSIDVMAKARELGQGPISTLKDVLTTIKARNKDKVLYKYIILDTVTVLEGLLEPYVTKVYKNTPQGNEYKGDSIVMDLDYGKGYKLLRDEMSSIISELYQLADTIVLLAHVKDGSIKIKGKDIAISDVDLTGKMKNIVAGKCDAIGNLYRSDEEEGVNYLSFKTTSTDIVVGARPAHLSNMDFKISVRDPETKVLTTFWNQIFLNL